MGQQQVVHLPERVLVGGGFRSLGGELGMGMDVVERQVPPDVPDLAVAGQKLPQDGLGLAAVGALEVPVLHDGDRRNCWAADPVTARINRGIEVGDDLGGAERGPDLQPGRQQRGLPGRSAR